MDRARRRWIQLQEAGPTINGTALAGIKRDGCRCLAVGAVGTDFEAVFLTRLASGLDRFETLGLRFLTFFAPFRRILELLVAKESLFTRGPDEVASAVDTRQKKVLELVVRFALARLALPGCLEMSLGHTNRRSV